VRVARAFVVLAIFGSAGLAWSGSCRAQDYNSAESLCVAYAGQPILVARGQTKSATCDYIRNVVAGLREAVKATPFGALARRIKSNPDKPWAEILTSEPTLRQSCSREWSLREVAYGCRMSGIDTRVVLNQSGTIARWEIPVPASSPLLANQFALQRAEDGVDSYTGEGVRFMLDALAMRFRQLASDGESYNVSGASLVVTIINVHGS